MLNVLKNIAGMRMRGFTNYRKVGQGEIQDNNNNDNNNNNNIIIIIIICVRREWHS